MHKIDASIYGYRCDHPSENSMRGYSTGKRLAFKQAMFIIISFAQKMCRSDLKTMTLAVRLTVLYACLEVALDMAQS
jgi:hypothetical protein